jgi:hypothetical protein
MSCDPKPFIHKRGASFLLLVRIPSAFADGHFAGWVPTAQVRTDKGELVADLAVAWQDPVTTRILELECIDTVAWPVGSAEFDVRLTDPDGFVVTTSTASFHIVRGATHA